MRLAYWAITMAGTIADSKTDDFMREFIRFFIECLGVSPFIKCYRDSTLIHACVNAKQVDFLKLLLNYKYEVYDLSLIHI